MALVAPPAPVAPVELAALAAQGQPNEITNRDRQNRGAESAPDRTIWVLGKMPELYCQKMMDLYCQKMMDLYGVMDLYGL